MADFVDVGAVVKSALTFHQQGQLAEALVEYDKALSSSVLANPDEGQIQLKSTLLSNKGAIYMSVGQYEEAASTFEEATIVMPRLASAHYNLAIVLTSKLDNHRKALKHCALALKYDSDNFKTMHLMGNIMQGLGRLEDAEKYFVMAENMANPGEVIQREESAGSELSWNHLQISQLDVGDVVSRAIPAFTLNEEISSDAREIKMECLSTRPSVFRIHSLLTDKECDSIAMRADASLEKSLTMGGNTNTESKDKDSDSRHEAYRSSSNTWLPLDALLQDIQHRLALLLEVEIPVLQRPGNSEELQVIYYEDNQQFKAHHDSSAFHTRLFTSLLYLNSLTKEQGGGTWFPFVSNEGGLPATVQEGIEAVLNGGDGGKGLVVQPVKGDAVLFFNHLPDGELDTAAIHSALPVEAGNKKWAANFWFNSLQ